MNVKNIIIFTLAFFLQAILLTLVILTITKEDISLVMFFPTIAIFIYNYNVGFDTILWFIGYTTVFYVIGGIVLAYIFQLLKSILSSKLAYYTAIFLPSIFFTFVVGIAYVQLLSNF